MNFHLMGIDPGKSGGLAVFFELSEPPEMGDSLSPEPWVIRAYKLPVHATEMRGLVERLVFQEGSKRPWRIYLENVPSYIGKGIPESRAFALGKQVGLIEGIIVGLGISLFQVRPQEWAKVVGVGTRGKRSRVQWKSYLKSTAAAMFPEAKTINATADALLILRYAMVMEKQGE